MKYIAEKDIKDIGYYQELDNTTIFVDDLKHKGLELVNEAKTLNMKILGAKGASPKHKNWIRAIAIGKSIPRLIKIIFPNNVILLDYNNFDTNKENVPLEEMQLIVDELASYADQGCKMMTGNSLITSLLGDFEERLVALKSEEKDNYDFLVNAIKGGANWIAYPNIIENYEIHYDYHQLYAYVMTHNKFPYGGGKLVEGYYESPFAIYQIIGTAKLKKDGYPIIPSEDKALGGDGKEFSLASECPYLCNIDLELLMANYDLKDFYVVRTFYYDRCFDGSDQFNDLVNIMYNKRKLFKGKPQGRLYKQLNEIIPGHFEMSEYVGDFYTKDFTNSNPDKIKRYNPKVGIWITAYARKMLYELLLRCNKKDVIGFDTDCVFLRKDYHLDDITGDNPGQIHEDGRYINVVHYASKRYVGFDYYTGEYFEKISGKSKTGKGWKYNKEKNNYELVEVAYEARQFTF